MRWRRAASLALLATVFRLGVSKKEKPPEVDDTVRTHFKIPAGTKPFKLSCPIKNADPDDGIMVRWTKDEEEISSAEWGTSPYRLINGDFDLKIRNPQLSDSGHYRCMLVNGFGHKEVEFTLQVYDANSVRRENPSEAILLTNHASSPVWFDRNTIDQAVKQPLRLTRGKRLELRCPASGNPLPKITWSKNGNPITLELTSPSSAKLAIDNVNVEDSGMYACRLENSLGSLEADFRVFVSPLDDDNDSEMLGDAEFFGAEVADEKLAGENKTPASLSLATSSGLSGLPQPMIDQLYNTTVRAGHTAQFHCKVQWRQDAPTMRWLRKIDDPVAVRSATPNATILHIHDMHLLVLDQQHNEAPSPAPFASNDDEAPSAFVNKLLIPNVQRADAGRYFCVVSNAAGQFVFRSVYLNVAEGGRFPPFATSINVTIASIVAVVLTLVTLAVVWLCHNSTGGTDASLPSMKSISLTAPHQMSSTSSASSSASSGDKSLIAHGGGDQTNILFLNGNGDIIKPPGVDEMSHPPPPPPPPPPQIPLPPAPPLIAPTNTPASVISAEVQQQLLMQHHQRQQQIFLQQQQRLFDNNFPAHRSQTHLHYDARSPLLSGEYYQPQHHLTNGEMSIGELLYPSTMTLDRRCANERMYGPNFQQQQHMLHRTRAEDEMSRVSRHIYEILAENPSLPPQSPTMSSRRHQSQDNNNNFSHHEAPTQLRPPAKFTVPLPPSTLPPVQGSNGSGSPDGEINGAESAAFNAGTWKMGLTNGRAPNLQEHKLKQRAMMLHNPQNVQQRHENPPIRS